MHTHIHVHTQGISQCKIREALKTMLCNIADQPQGSNSCCGGWSRLALYIPIDHDHAIVSCLQLSHLGMQGRLNGMNSRNTERVVHVHVGVGVGVGGK